MQIFLAASLRAKDDMGDVYQLIVDHLSEKHTVMADHVLSLEQSTVKKWSSQYHFEYYQHILKTIPLAEMVVAEMSYDSINVGYEMSLALQLDKPLLVLYRGYSVPKMVKYLDQDLLKKNCVLQPYTKANLRKRIDQGLDELAEFVDQRLSVNIPSSLIFGLDAVAKHQKTTRKEIVKLAISNFLRLSPRGS